MDYDRLTALNPVVAPDDSGAWDAIDGPDRDETAAMVYVGDVYALVAVDGVEDREVSLDAPHDQLWPLIR